jgi:MFS family permease
MVRSGARRLGGRLRRHWDGSASPGKILATAVVAQTGISFLEQGVPTLTVFVKHDLGLSAAAAGALISIMGVGRLSGFYLAGRAVDIHGERRVLFTGACLAGAMMVVAAVVPFTAMLMVFFVVGLFLSTATPAGGKLVYTAFGDERRELAMGVRQAAVPLGGLLAAGLLPLVAEDRGWRTGFVVAGVVPAIGAAFGFSLSGVGARMARAARRVRPATRDILTRDFRLWTVWATVMVGSQYVVLTFYAVDVKERAEVSGRTAALMLLVVQAGGIVGRIVWGWIADRRPGSRARILPVTMTVVAIGSSLALALLPLRGLVSFAVLGLAVGISINAWQGLWMTRMTEMAGVADAGTATGVSLTFMATGWIVFTPGFGAVADASGSFPVMWAVLAGVLAAALVAVIAMGKPPATPVA